jgi:tetratricopeptide (TPR) repeat protein
MMDPDRVQWAAKLEAGRQAVGAKQLGSAEHAYRSALQFARRFGLRSPEVLESLKQLASHYQHTGRPSQAVRAGRRLLALQEATLGTSHPDLASTYELLIDACTGRNPREVERLYRSELGLVEHLFGLDGHQVAGVLSNLAGHLSAHRCCAEAVPLWERALAILERQRRRRHPPTSWAVIWTPALVGLATCYTQLGKHAEAERLHRRMLRHQVRQRGPESIALTSALFPLAVEVRAQGRLAQAAVLLQRAVAIQEAWWASREDSIPAHARGGILMLRMAVLREHAAVLRELGRTAAAAAVEARIQLHETRFGATNSVSKGEPLTALPQIR